MFVVRILVSIIYEATYLMINGEKLRYISQIIELYIKVKVKI